MKPRFTPEVEESGESGGSEADVEGEASGAATKPDDFISVHSSPSTTQSRHESDSDSSNITIIMNTQADLQFVLFLIFNRGLIHCKTTIKGLITYHGKIIVVGAMTGPLITTVKTL